MDRLSITEAAHALGLSQDTIRKRLRSGDLQGQKVKAAGGFRWEVFVFEDPTINSDTDNANDANGNALVEILREELAENNRLHGYWHKPPSSPKGCQWSAGSE